MVRIVNKKISTLITHSIKQLKDTLSTQELQSVKSEFMDIHNNRISTNNSFNKMIQEKLVETGKEYKISEPFYNIGNLINIPVHTGSTELLRNVYQEDISDNNLNEQFINYQLDVIGYVYDQVNTDL
jgi:hypothetical protein